MHGCYSFSRVCDWQRVMTDGTRACVRALRNGIDPWVVRVPSRCILRGTLLRVLGRSAGYGVRNLLSNMAVDRRLVLLCSGHRLACISLSSLRPLQGQSPPCAAPHCAHQRARGRGRGGGPRKWDRQRQRHVEQSQQQQGARREAAAAAKPKHARLHWCCTPPFSTPLIHHQVKT